MDKVMGVKNTQCELLYAQRSRVLDTQRDRQARRLQNETGRLQQEFRIMQIDRKLNQIEDRKRQDPDADTTLEVTTLEQAFRFLRSDAESPHYLDRKQKFPIRVTIQGTEESVTHSVAKARKVLQDMALEKQLEIIQGRRQDGKARESNILVVHAGKHHVTHHVTHDVDTSDESDSDARRKQGNNKEINKKSKPPRKDKELNVDSGIDSKSGSEETSNKKRKHTKTKPAESSVKKSQQKQTGNNGDRHMVQTGADDMELGADYRSSVIPASSTNHHGNQRHHRQLLNQSEAPSETTHGWVTSEATTSSNEADDVSQSREILIIKQRLQRRARELAAQAKEESNDSSSNEDPLLYQDLSDYKILLSKNKEQINYNYNRVMTARPALQSVPRGLPQVTGSRKSVDDTALPDIHSRSFQGQKDAMQSDGHGTIDAHASGEVHKSKVVTMETDNMEIQEAASDLANRGRAITSFVRQTTDSRVPARSVTARPRRVRRGKQPAVTNEDLRRERSDIEDKMGRFFGSLEDQKRREEAARRRDDVMFDIEDTKHAQTQETPKGKQTSEVKQPLTRKVSEVQPEPEPEKLGPPMRTMTFPGVTRDRPVLRRTQSTLSSTSTGTLPSLGPRPTPGVPQHSARRSNRHSATFKLQKIMAEMLRQSSTSQLMEFEELRHKADDTKPEAGNQADDSQKMAGITEEEPTKEETS